MQVSEALLSEVGKDKRLRVVEEPGPIRFNAGGSLL
jgi:hypothetical protein